MGSVLSIHNVFPVLASIFVKQLGKTHVHFWGTISMLVIHIQRVMERFAAGISFPHTVQFKQSQICSIVNDEH